MTDKAAPTITLAELYENQDQSIDALVIYKNLNKENPSENLQNKIDELKDKIFKENTLEYSTIIDKIFTEEEKRLFHILPNEQYKAYKDSQADLKNDETYPEELIAVDEEIIPDETVEPEIENEELKIDDALEPEIEEEEEEIIEPENKIDNDIEELIEEKEEPKPEVEIVPEINEPETPDIEEIPEIEETENLEINNVTESELTIDEEEKINIDDTSENNKQLEDDISLEIDEDIQEKPDVTIEPKTQPEEAVSIEDIMKKKTDEQNDTIENNKIEPENNFDYNVKPIIESDTDNHILELLTSLSKMRPDIVDRVLKENIGSEASLAEIKLSDLHYVVELLKVSENVEKN